MRKAADEPIASNAVVQDDDDFFFAIAASETWIFQMMFAVTCTVNGGFRYTVSAPAGATGEWRAFQAFAGIDIAGAAWGTENSTTAVQAERNWVLHGTVINSTTAGNVRLRWAQSVSHADTTTVHSFGSLLAHRVG